MGGSVINEQNNEQVQNSEGSSSLGSVEFVENIGMGTVGYNFFEAWKASPGHNGKLLKASMFGSVGVAVIEYNE